MLGVGIFVSFSRPGGRRSFVLKSCPGAEILTKKISGQGRQPKGMVTGQIDTCIIQRERHVVHGLRDTKMVHTEMIARNINNIVTPGNKIITIKHPFHMQRAASK